LQLINIIIISERLADMNVVSAQYAKCQTPPWAQEHHQTLLGYQSDDEITSLSAIGTTTTTILMPFNKHQFPVYEQLV
jgi:hypothetical protein